MPTIGNPKSGTEINCGRCGSPRKVSKKWVEKIENSAGFMVLNHTEYKCTNKECQEAFDKEMIAEAEKREKIKQMKSGNSPKTA